MQIVDSKEEIGLLNRPPACNTTLGLSFHPLPASSSPSSSVKPSQLALLASPLAFAHNPADQDCFRPVQLELLPLRPTSHRPPAPNFLWQPPVFASSASTTTVAATPTQITRGIDVNQIPSSVDCDDAADSSPTRIFSPFATESACRTDNGFPLKREREKFSDQEQDRMCEVSSRGSDEEENGGTRKKLRLSKEQSALLEESFKEHSTLNPKQKNALAKQLNLRPRQVEVWFQNRRARTKLKQTEVDCELLKRCCESLTEENRRLQKELQELRAIKVAPPCVIAQDFYMPLPAATLTMCPSCERLATLDNRTLSFAKQQHAHHFSQPSAAC